MSSWNNSDSNSTKQPEIQGQMFNSSLQQDQSNNAANLNQSNVSESQSSSNLMNPVDKNGQLFNSQQPTMLPPPPAINNSMF